MGYDLEYIQQAAVAAYCPKLKEDIQTDLGTLSRKKSALMSELETVKQLREDRLGKLYCLQDNELLVRWELAKYLVNTREFKKVYKVSVHASFRFLSRLLKPRMTKKMHRLMKDAKKGKPGAEEKFVLVMLSQLETTRFEVIDIIQGLAYIQLNDPDLDLGYAFVVENGVVITVLMRATTKKGIFLKMLDAVEFLAKEVAYGDR